MSKKKHHKSAGNNSEAVQPEQKTQKTIASPGGLKSITNWLILLVIFIPVMFSEKTMDPNITIRYIFM